MDIVKVLTKERKLQKVSQEKIAKECGISKAMISRIERSLSSPNYNYLEKYAEYLGYEIRLLKK